MLRQLAMEVLQALSCDEPNYVKLNHQNSSGRAA